MRRSDAVASLAATLGVSSTELRTYVRELREAGEFSGSLPGRAPNPVTEDDLVNLLIGYCASSSAKQAPDALATVRRFTRTSSFTGVDPEKRLLPAFAGEETFEAALRQAISNAYDGEIMRWLRDEAGLIVGRFEIRFETDASGVHISAERWRRGRGAKGRDEFLARFDAYYAADDKPRRGDLSQSRSVGHLTLHHVGELLEDESH